MRRPCPGVPQIATGYGKMLQENDITEPEITSENRRKMNHITGFDGRILGAQPLGGSSVNEMLLTVTWGRLVVFAGGQSNVCYLK